MPTSREGHVSTLWNLSFNGDRVTCVIYHGSHGMELRLESPTGIILSEPFDMQPRAMARTRALRKSLERRGWRDANPKSQSPNPKPQ